MPFQNEKFQIHDDMRRIISLTSLLIFCINLNAQYYWYGGYSPSPCYENDSINIIDTVSLGGLNDYRINSEFNIIGDTITISSCYLITSGPQVSYPFGEITRIGKLTKGTYIVKIIGTMTHNC
jgi:hypothetical protein